MVARIFLGVLIGGAIGSVVGYFGKCSSGSCPLTANPYRGAIYGAVLGVLLATVFSQTAKKEESSNIVHIGSDADFKTRLLDSNGIYLVDLFSNRCPPCKVLAPTISSLADKYVGKVTVCKVNLDQAPSVARRCGVSAIPTVLIIKDGKEVNRLVGLRPESEYIALLDKLVNQAER